MSRRPRWLADMVLAAAAAAEPRLAVTQAAEWRLRASTAWQRRLAG